MTRLVAEMERGRLARALTPGRLRGHRVRAERRRPRPRERKRGADPHTDDRRTDDHSGGELALRRHVTHPVAACAVHAEPTATTRRARSGAALLESPASAPRPRSR